MRKKPDPFLTDEDNPPLDDSFWKEARPLQEIEPPEFFDEMKRLGDERIAQLAKEGRKPFGRPPLSADRRKTVLTLRLAPDLKEAIRATGPGYNARAENVLRAAFMARSSRRR